MTPHVPIVGLRDSDRPYVQMHFLSLGDEALRARFGSARSPEAVRDYVARIDFVRDRLFAVQGEEGSLAAIAHVAISNGLVQLAVTVLPGWRKRGLGTALLARAVEHLRLARTTADEASNDPR